MKKNRGRERPSVRGGVQLRAKHETMRPSRNKGILVINTPNNGLYIQNRY